MVHNPNLQKPAVVGSSVLGILGINGKDLFSQTRDQWGGGRSGVRSCDEKEGKIVDLVVGAENRH